MSTAAQLVRDLLDKVSSDGDESSQAALALGLLVQREKVTFPPGDDGGVEQTLGAAMAAQRLGPMEIHDAVNGLIARMRDPRLPAPFVVWAAARSFDPRIVPHLVALLERVVEQADRTALARQIVDGLTHFFDARAVAGIRLAAARGTGEVRDSAGSWLALHGHKEPRPPAARVHAPWCRMEVGGDVHRLQRRPGHREIIVNDAGRGLRVIDPWNTTERGRIAFAPGYEDSGQIHAWFVHGGGECVAVFAASGAGSLLWLTGQRSADLRAPGPLVENPAYCWDADGALLVRADASAFWTLRLDGDAAAIELIGALEARKRARSWMKVLDELRPLRSRVLRVEPDAGRMLGYDYATTPGHLVALAWRDPSAIRVPTRGYVPNAAFHGDRLYLLYDHEVQAVDVDGNVTDVFRAPDGMYLRALDTLPAGNDEPPALVVAASPMFDVEASALLTYALVD